MFKKNLLSIFTIGIFGIFLGYQKVQSTQERDLAAATSKAEGSPSTANNSAQIFSDTPPPISVSSSKYKDGTYVGNEVDAYYGYIKVKAVVQNGKLADIVFLEYPNDQRESVEINTRAMPELRSEAISAQSANVSIVSRATDSSLAFRQSLASALSSAIN